MKKFIRVSIAAVLCLGLFTVVVDAKGKPGPTPRVCGSPLCWGTG